MCYSSEHSSHRFVQILLVISLSQKKCIMVSYLLSHCMFACGLTRGGSFYTTGGRRENMRSGVIPICEDLASGGRLLSWNSASGMLYLREHWLHGDLSNSALMLHVGGKHQPTHSCVTTHPLTFPCAPPLSMPPLFSQQTMLSLQRGSSAFPQRRVIRSVSRADFSCVTPRSSPSRWRQDRKAPRYCQTPLSIPKVRYPHLADNHYHTLLLRG